MFLINYRRPQFCFNIQFLIVVVNENFNVMLIVIGSYERIRWRHVQFKNLMHQHFKRIYLLNLIYFIYRRNILLYISLRIVNIVE